jgi:hypothetical protein
VSRLVYADWLEERDDWRGQFLRLQVERDGYQPWDARGVALSAELIRLREEHGGGLFHPPSIPPTEPGGPWIVCIAEVVPAPYQGGLLASNFTLTGVPDPYGQWLTDLVLDFPHVEHIAGELRKPGARKYPLLWLRSKEIVHPAPNSVVETLADADTSALRFLHIDCFCSMATAAAWQRISLGSLHGLSLPAGTVSARGLSCAVLTYPTIAGVRSLTLGSGSDWDDFTRWLASSPCWAGLETFSLMKGILSITAARKLAKALPGTRLRHLAWDWSGGSLDSPGPLVKGCLRVPLESLTLAGVPLLRDALAVLHHPSLVALDLHGSPLRNEGLAALLEQASLPRLSVLSLADNSLTGPGIRTLAGSDLLGRLTALDLSGNGHHGRSGWLKLFASANLGQLESLSLRGCRLDDVLVAALARAPHLGRLQALDLGDNPLTDVGLRMVAEAPGLPVLRYLLVPKVPLRRATLAALCERFAVVVT